MDLKNRIKIEIFLKEGLSLKSIANKLEVSVSTVSREIKNNKIIEQNVKNTDKKEIKSTCELLKLPPYVCNGCPRYLNKTCTKHYEIYCSNIANEKSFSRKSAANIKNIDKRIEIVKLLNDLLSKKQTIGHIHSVLKETYPNDAPTIQTIYNWIKKGIIKHNLKKYRKKHKEIKEKIEYKKLSEYLKGDERLLFQLIDKRYEKKSTIITTNLNFNEWTRLFYDEKIASAIIDRLLHHATVVSITGNSYRLKEYIKEE